MRILVGDDAKQTKHVSDDFGLCWVHEGRHYKELSRWCRSIEQQLEAFRNAFLGPSTSELQKYQSQADAGDGRTVAGGVRPTLRDTDGVRGIG